MPLLTYSQILHASTNGAFRATLLNSAVAYEIVRCLLTDSAKPFGVTHTVNSSNPDGALVVRSLPCELPFALTARGISEGCEVTQAQQAMKSIKALRPEKIPSRWTRRLVNT